MFIRAYLRASTEEQDASRAKAQLEKFASDNNQKIASTYIENVSGRTLHRPQLMKLIEEAGKGDVILIESVDRLTRLTSDDWDTLKGIISEKLLSVVAVDLPTSHKALEPIAKGDDMSRSILKAVNQMLIDILATMAAKDYEMRRQRADQGIEKAKQAGKYKGRQANTSRNEGIKKMLASGASYSEIQATTGAARATIAKLRKEV
mgnify:CR=1 FL=1|tara:strand:+ start:6320 stop:6934 length:615 start_codon:yes stop_codon:yes gene_type:complete